MTAEPWCPVPFDDHPYENGPLDTADVHPSGAGGTSAVSSRPVSRPPNPGIPAGLLTFSGEVSEPGWIGPNADGDQRSGETEVPLSPTDSSGSLTFHCAACLLEWPEAFCDICGRNLVQL